MLDKKALLLNDPVKTLGTAISFVIFSILMSDGVNLSLTSFNIAVFELIFVVLFLFLNQRLISLTLLFNNAIIKALFMLWLVSTGLSYVKLFLSDATSLQLSLATNRYLYTLLHIVFGLCLTSLLYRKEAIAETLLGIIPLSLIIFMMVFAVTIWTFDYLDPFIFFNFPPLSSHMRYVGYLATAGSIIAGYQLIVSKYSSQKTLLFALLWLANFAFLIWLGGRTAIGSVVLVLFIYLCYAWHKNRLFKANAAWLAFTGILAIIVAQSLTIFPWNGLGRLFDKLPFASNDSIGISEFSSGRWEIWKFALDGTADSIWLGLGPHGYIFIPERFFGVQPHNLFIQLIVEWGLVGASLFLTLLGLFLYNSIKVTVSSVNAQTKRLECALLVFMGLTIHSLTDGTYFHSQPIVILIVCGSILAAAILKEKRQ